MDHPDLTARPPTVAVTLLSRRIQLHIRPKLLHTHQKTSNADLIGVVILQGLHKVPDFSRWWRFLKLNYFPDFPTESQARIRLARLIPVIERLATEIQALNFIAVRCRRKRCVRSVSASSWPSSTTFPNPKQGVQFRKV